MRGERGPQYVNDGILSTNSHGIFISSWEDYPWLQWHLPILTRITAVSTANGKDCCGERLKNVEIRAGMDNVNSTVQAFNLQGRIVANEICGNFEGPGEDGKVYTIKCGAPIFANYITVQIINQEQSILQINELKFITDSIVLIGKKHNFMHRK